ncbi:hypothetical protein V5799_030569 [Amblyomma americanum]|uniref:Uncharacterized protein n=1 Tax=Amblyomma americanum TaxID=6943 RepID=A0AAQ4ENG6_AMBAM
MAGMAWTLHPALFYDKYGPVLVQLWESGALGALFRPPGTDVELGVVEASELRITDASVATDDEAWTRVNREPGDTSPEPSTSQQNELAFQGDLYTQLRRNRRQQERIEKIRENRRKFLEGSHSSASSRKRRVPGRVGSILVSKKEKALHRKVGGVGTPLTDMEGVPQPRGVVIDTGGSSDSGESSEAEAAGGAPAKRGGQLLAQELRSDNDSLKAFRAIRGGKKKGGVSPPPNFGRQSDTETETGSISSEMPQEALSVGSPAVALDLMTPTGEQPKRSSLKTRKGSKPSVGPGQQDASAASILRSDKEIKMKALELPDHRQARHKGSRSPTVASLEIGTSAVKGSLPHGGVSVSTTMQSKDERPVSSEESSSMASPSGAITKKEKTKKKKTRSHKKKGKHKSKAAHGKGQETAVVHQDSYKAGEQKPGADVESQEPSPDVTSSSVSPGQPGPSDGALKAAISGTTVLQKGPEPKQGSTERGSLKVTNVPLPVRESTVSKEAGKESQAEKIASASSPPSTKRHKKHTKKRKSKWPAAAEDILPRPAVPSEDGVPVEPEDKVSRPLPSESPEKTFDEAADTHRIRSGHFGHKKHHRAAKRSHKKTAALSSAPGSLAAIGQTQPLPATADGGLAQGAAPPGGTKEVAASSQPPQEDANAADMAGVSTSSASSIRRLLNLPSMDATASEASTTRNMTTERRPGNVTVVQGNDVTIRLDLASRNKMFMFWPFRRKDKKKK